MDTIIELLSESSVADLEVLKLKSIPETQNIAVLKTNQVSEFFIEVLDFEN